MTTEMLHALLCYSCSLATGRDVPYGTECYQHHHAQINAQKWYDRYYDGAASFPRLMRNHGVARIRRLC